MFISTFNFNNFFFLLRFKIFCEGDFGVLNKWEFRCDIYCCVQKWKKYIYNIYKDDRGRYVWGIHGRITLILDYGVFMSHRTNLNPFWCLPPCFIHSHPVIHVAEKNSEYIFLFFFYFFINRKNKIISSIKLFNSFFSFFMFNCY